MDVAAYLSRIGLAHVPAANRDGLERLQRAHMTAIPFENLHVFAKRGVRTDVQWSEDKIVNNRRGGWCFELNGAFAGLLEAIGFSVGRLAATVLFNDAVEGSHLTLRVDLDRPYLVDVGFGDGFICPLPLDSPGKHPGGPAQFSLSVEDGWHTLMRHDPGADPAAQYRFTMETFAMTDFVDMSNYLQSEPTLDWSNKRFATRLLDGGPDRVVLRNDVLRLFRDGTWTETHVAPAAWASVLAEWFSMTP